MKIPPCLFIRACLFIKIQEFFHPACLLEPARLLGRQEYFIMTKFHSDRAKIVDFLLMVNFRPSRKFLSTVST